MGHSYRREGVNGKPRYAAIYHDNRSVRRSACGSLHSPTGCNRAEAIRAVIAATPSRAPACCLLAARKEFYRIPARLSGSHHLR